MAKRDFTRSWGSPRMLPKTNQEGVSQARDEIPSGPQSGQQRVRKRNSRRSKKPTRCSPTRKSAKRMTATVTPASIRTWAAAAGAAPAVSPMRSATSSATSSAAARWRGRRPARRCTAAPTCATTWRSRWNRRRTASTPRSACRPGTSATPATVQRRQAGHVAGHLLHLRRPWPGAHAAGLLQHPADLPEMPRHRQDHSGTMQRVLRRRAASSATKRWK
jgi:hypothetical protein